MIQVPKWFEILAFWIIASAGTAAVLLGALYLWFRVFSEVLCQLRIYDAVIEVVFKRGNKQDGESR